MKKLIFVILDGAAGRPCEELNGLTTLEAARTPNLDFLTKKGKTGEIVIIDEKIPPETESAVLALFGYDPLIYNRGRGPLEAYGIDAKFEQGDLITRCNFATIKDNRIIDTRAGRIGEKHAKKLVDSLNTEVKLQSHPVKMNFIHTLNYRAVLILHSKKGILSDQISNTHPGYERKPGYLELPKTFFEEPFFKECIPLDDKEESKISATLINEFTKKSREILEKHRINEMRKKKGLPVANIILMRGAGTSLPQLDDLKEKYGKSWLCLGDTPAEKGIAKLLGMDVISLPNPLSDELSKNATVEEIEKKVKKDMKIRVEKLLKRLEKYDCIYIHLKGPDPFGHAGLPKLKMKVIEEIDRWFFGEILKRINLEETIISVTSDHSTPCSLKSHSADPVPLLISGGKIDSDGTEKFGESFCKKGSIGRIRATELLPLLMKIMGDEKT
jgi:2,3-bisphosphoglycerate-independent phosphoglycerate mutase